MTPGTPSRNSGLIRKQASAPASAWQPDTVTGTGKGSPRLIAKDLRLESEYLGSMEASAVIPVAEASAAQAWTPPMALPGLSIKPLVPMTGRSGSLGGLGPQAFEDAPPPAPRRVLKSGNASPWKPVDIPSRPAAGVSAVSRTLFHSPELARQAQEELDQARAEAERILREAREQADAVTQKAKLDGRAAAEEETRATLAAAAAVLAETGQWRDAMVSHSESIVLELVRDIAKAMFGAGVSLEPAALRKAFERAMAEARAIGDLRIHVNPEDAMALGTEWWQQAQASLGGQRIELMASETVKRGGCFIEGEFGSVDARVETQLQTVLKTLGGEEA